MGGSIWTGDSIHRLSNWLKGELETPKDYCRKEVTILAGEQMVSGTVVGKITASGKYTSFDPAASDGSGVAAGVLITDFIEGDTSVDEKGVILATGPAEVVRVGLTWNAAATDNQKDAAMASLLALGIHERESA